MIFTKQFLLLSPLFLYGTEVVTANPVPGNAKSAELKTLQPLEPPGPQFPHGFVWSKYTSPTYDDSCDPNHRNQLDKYFSEALHMVDYVVGMKDEYTNRKGNAYKAFIDLDGDGSKVGETRFNDVKMVFRRIRQNLIDEIDEEIPPPKKDKVKVSCGDHEDCTSGSGKGNLAFRLASQHALHFCGSFFSEAKKVDKANDFSKFACKPTAANSNLIEFDFKQAGFDPQNIEKIGDLGALTIIHEMSHLYNHPECQITNPDAPDQIKKVAIIDCFYGAYAAEYLARVYSNPEANGQRTIRPSVCNADNYAWFAITHYISNLCYNADINKALPQIWLREFKDTRNPSFLQQLKSFNEAKPLWEKLEKEYQDADKKKKRINKEKTGYMIKLPQERTEEHKKRIAEYEEGVKTQDKIMAQKTAEKTKLKTEVDLSMENKDICELGVGDLGRIAGEMDKRVLQ